MAIITISRGCFSHGKEIAERVAERLGYECISKEVLLEAAYLFKVPEGHLTRSIQEAPGLLDRFTHKRAHFLSCVQTALLEHVNKDNVVYHGHAGAIFLPGIRHVFNVRIIAEMDVRVALVCKQNGICQEAARQLIENEDRQREAWYHDIYKKDMNDPSLYDMVLHIGRLTIDSACDQICTAAASDTFKSTAASRSALNDLTVKCHVQTVLADVCEAEVDVVDGVLKIKVKSQRLRNTGFTRPGTQQRVKDYITQDLQREIAAMISKVPGIKNMVCDIIPPHYV